MPVSFGSPAADAETGSGFQQGRVGITTPTRAGLLGDIEARLAQAQGFAVATLNLDHIVKLRQDPAFLQAYLKQTHVVADGNPIVWLLRLAGRHVELIPGSELIEPMAEIAARQGTPIGLFGSRQETLDLAAERLQRRYPGLTVAARIAPPMGFDPTGPMAQELLDQLRASGARLVFLAMGAPKQEIFAAMAHVRAPEIGFVSIGAGIDFIAGSQKRAPRWVRRLAMEWLWRMVSNPRRLAKRYASCFSALPTLVLQALRDGRSRTAR